MEPIRQARVERPLSLYEMNRQEAQSERDRMADEQPQATWLVAEQKPGEWAVVRVGLAPTDPTGSSSEARPQPDYPEDPRPAQNLNSPYRF
jgi:hypothetical protein